jgi:hypothetical protein
MSTIIDPVGSVIGSRRQHRLLDRPLLDRGGAVGHADHDLGLGEHGVRLHLPDEILDHFLGDVEIGDDAVAHRPDRLDRARRAAKHQLGVLADRLDHLLAVDGLVSHDRGLVQDDALALDIDQRVRCPEIDRHVAREYAEQSAEHVPAFWFFAARMSP